MNYCHKCGTEWKAGASSRKDVCPSCHTDMRVCLNCEFYLDTAPNQCREPNIELVAEKDKSNFCDHFRLANLPSPPSRGLKKDDMKSKWDGLFR